EEFAVECVNNLDLTAAEASQFQVTVLLNVKIDRIEVWQLSSCRICFPVISIALQKDVRPWPVVRQHKRTEHGTFLKGRVRRHDCNLVEEFVETDYGTWEGDRDLTGSQPLHADLSRGRAKGVASWRMQIRIHQGIACECNIIRSERRPIGELQPRAERKCDASTVFRDLPRRCQFRLKLLSFPIKPD